MAALFLAAGLAKLAGQEMMVAEFETVGLGQWFRYVTGILEVVGAVALVVPAVSAFGAVLLLMVDVGAFVAQVAVLHGDLIHVIVIGVILAVLVYMQRQQITDRLGR
jgi:uncharacterized membrane protein YphA (DoxX/SURF4 family)